MVGDSRGRWEGETLVVAVTNFSPKTDFQGSRENLHLVERWTRLDAETIKYLVTMDDPTTWTRLWTVALELSRQSNEANRIYKEPRCHEGNYGLPALLRGARHGQRRRSARHALAHDPVFNPPKDVFDLACADIRIEQPNRELAVQRSVWSLQPRRRLLFSAKHRNGLTGHMCDSIQAIGFVGIQLPCLAPPCHRPSRHMKDVGSLGHRQSEPFANGLKRAVREPLSDALS